MYIPKKLQQNFELSKEKLVVGNIIVNGSLSCCGQSDFAIHYLGELVYSLLGRKIINVENEALVFIATCKICGKKIQVFNSYTDGYDGCINCENGYHEPPLPELTSFLCPKCLKNVFSIEITFEYQSKEELEEDGVQEYENAFSWIWISLTCSSCKRKLKSLIDMETA